MQMNEASSKILALYEQNIIRKIFQKHNNHFKYYLGSGRPVQMTSKKSRRFNSKNAITAKVERYSADEKKSVND